METVGRLEMFGGGHDRPNVESVVVRPGRPWSPPKLRAPQIALLMGLGSLVPPINYQGIQMCIFFVQTRSQKKIRASGLFCQMDKFSGIPPNIGFDWVLSINILVFCR